MVDMQKITGLLERIYGKSDARAAADRLCERLARCPPRPRRRGYFSERDAVLITYGDSLRRAGEAPLKTFAAFARPHFRDVFSAVHFLPFFPYSSDDGFAVIDFKAVDPALGTWADVEALQGDFRLMFDLVLNHISARSPWFKAYLKGEATFADLAIEVDPEVDLRAVVRPRALPLLTPFQTADGRTVHLWTTFSADQVDLNYRSPDVLAHMLDVLLAYVERGASLLRLDAVAYLWKEIGTDCVHRPQTHDMVRLLRAVLDQVAPDALLITETNVPHTENVSYFGDGRDEAQMVYNFTLPPLLLYTLLKGDATRFARWVAGLRTPSAHTTFFNFTASHDGIGVRPLEGILAPAEIEELAATVVRRGGRVSYRQQADGSQSPYELNITYLDALTPKGERRPEVTAARFMASQSIQYALPGVPATYIHSVLGSRNWQAGVRQTGRARSINREKLEAAAVLAALRDEAGLRARIFGAYVRMVAVRRRQPAFHPQAGLEVLPCRREVFGIVRRAAEQTLYALTNITSRGVEVSLKNAGAPARMTDLVSEKRLETDPLRLQPYQFVWLVESGTSRAA